MKSYTYFPGCSSSQGAAVAYNESIKAISGQLGIELIELRDWNCCGSTPYTSTYELESLCVAARNLALAEKIGKDLVTPCSSCNITLNRVNLRFRQFPELKEKVQRCLAEIGLQYNGSVHVRHLLEVIYIDIGLEAISSKVTNPLTGLKVAAYYGCQILRPDIAFDNPDKPESLESLISSLGAETIDFPMRDRCCGGLMIVPEPDLTLGLMRKLLYSAVRGGARCMITVCPLCQTNLDAFQQNVNKKFNTSFNLPVLFITQLIGLALGVSSESLALDKAVVSADKILKPYVDASLSSRKGTLVGR